MSTTGGYQTWASTLTRKGENPKTVPFGTLLRRQRQLIARHGRPKRPARLARRPSTQLVVNLAEDGETDAGDPEIGRLVAESERKRAAKSLAEAQARLAPYLPPSAQGETKMQKTKKQPASARDRAVIEKWEDKVRSVMVSEALLKSEAVRFLAVHEPGLHSDYLVAYNALARRDADLRSARGAVRREAKR